MALSVDLGGYGGVFCYVISLFGLVLNTCVICLGLCFEFWLDCWWVLVLSLFAFVSGFVYDCFCFLILVLLMQRSCRKCAGEIVLV